MKKKLTVFASGAVRDNQEGKEEYVETISWLALRRYAQYMTKMAAKYGRGNWVKGIPIENSENAAMRHLQKYLANKYQGAKLEPEVDHLSAVIFNIFTLMHEQERTKK